MVIVRKSSYHRLKENNNRKKRALNEREKQVENLEQEKADLAEQLVHAKQQSSGADLKAVVSEKDAAIQQLQSKLSSAHKEIESLKNFNEDTASQMHSKVKDVQKAKDEALQKLDEKVQYYEAHVKSLEKNSGNRKQQLIEASEQIDTLRNTVQMLESQLLTSAQSRTTLEKNLQQETVRRDTVVSQLNEEVASLKAALESGGQVAAPANAEEVEQLKKSNESLFGNLQSALQELKLSNSKVNEMRSDNEQLANAVSSYHEKYRRLLAKMHGNEENGANDGEENADAEQKEKTEVEELKEAVKEAAAAKEDEPVKENGAEEQSPPSQEAADQHGLDDLAQIVQEKVATE